MSADEMCYRCTYVEYDDPDEVVRVEVGNDDCYECHGTGVTYPKFHFGGIIDSAGTAEVQGVIHPKSDGA